MAAHAYWRLKVTDCANDGGVAVGLQFSEIEMRASIGGADECAGGTPSYSSALDGTNHPGLYGYSYATLLFDNNTGTFWASDNFEYPTPADPIYINYAFAAPVDIVQIAVSGGGATAVNRANAPKDFVLQFSDDDVTYTDFLTITGQVAWAVSDTRLFQAPITINADADITDADDTIDASGEVQYQLTLTDTMPLVDNAYEYRYKELVDAMLAADSTLYVDLPNLVDRITATGSAYAYTTLRNSLSDSSTFADAVQFAWAMLLAEAMELIGTAIGNQFKLASIVDTIAASGAVETRLDALAAVSAAIAIEGLIQNGWTMEAIDSVVFNDALTNAARLVAPLVDSATLTDGATNSARIIVLASDEAVGADTTLALLQMGAEASDSIVTYVTVVLAGTEYSGWVLNTANKAASEYENFPFESVAAAAPDDPFAGKSFGAGEGGLYELTGDEDDEDPIAASIRTGMLWSSMGMKRVADVWYGITGAGQVVLKLVHTSDNGELEEDWYISDADARTGAGMREGHIDVGRGVKSRAFGFELHNKAGGSLDLSGIVLRRILCDRRSK